MSSYQLPGVTLTQILVLPNATLQDANLFETVIGPLYRVIKNSIVFTNAVFTGHHVTPESPITINYPKVDPGAVIETSSIVLKLINGVVEFLTKNTGATGFNIANSNVFTDNNTDFIVAGVEAGDKLIAGEYGSLNGEYIVQSVSQHSLTLTYPIYKTFSGTDTGYKITRSIASYTIPTASYTANQTNIVVSSIADNGKNFISGEIQLSYRALRKDKTGLIKYTNLDDVEADMEVDYIENKLGYILKNAVVVGNGNSTAFLVYILDEDTDNAYLNALEELANYDNTYMLTILSNSLTVKQAYRNHAIAMSQTDESKFRIFLETKNLVSRSVLGSGTVTFE